MKNQKTRANWVKTFVMGWALFLLISLFGCAPPGQPPKFPNCFNGCPTYVVTTEEPTIIRDIYTWGPDITSFKYVPIKNVAGVVASFDKANVVYLIDRSKLATKDMPPDLITRMPSIPYQENQVMVTWKQRPRENKDLRYFDILISCPRDKFIKEEVLNLWNRLKDQGVNALKNADFYTRDTSLSVVFTNDKGAVEVFFKGSPNAAYDLYDIDKYLNLKDQLNDSEEIFIINSNLKLPKTFLPKDLLAHLPRDIWKCKEATKLVNKTDKSNGKSIIVEVAPTSDCLKDLAGKFPYGKVENYMGDVPDLRKWKRIITVLFDKDKTPALQESFDAELTNGFNPKFQGYFSIINEFFRDKYTRKLLVDVFMNRADPKKLVDLQIKARGDAFFFGQITSYTATTDYKWTSVRLTPKMLEFKFNETEPARPDEPKRDDWIFDPFPTAKAKYKTDEEFQKAHKNWEEYDKPKYDRDYRDWEDRKNRVKREYDEQVSNRRIEWDCKLMQTPSIYLGVTCTFVKDGLIVWSQNFNADVKDEIVKNQRTEVSTGENSSAPYLQQPNSENQVPPEFLTKAKDEIVRQFWEKLKSEVLLPKS